MPPILPLRLAANGENAGGGSLADEKRLRPEERQFGPRARRRGFRGLAARYEAGDAVMHMTNRA